MLAEAIEPSRLFPARIIRRRVGQGRKSLGVIVNQETAESRFALRKSSHLRPKTHHSSGLRDPPYEPMNNPG
jgi:hypothetical protein